MKPQNLSMLINDKFEVVRKPQRLLGYRDFKPYFAADPNLEDHTIPGFEQQAGETDFKLYASYAAQAMANPEFKEAYERMSSEHQTPYNRAFIDAIYTDPLWAFPQLSVLASDINKLFHFKRYAHIA